RLRDARPGVPASLDQAIHKAMARDPEQRYRSAEELADDLEALLAELSGAATASVGPRRWPAAANRSRLATVASLAAAAAAAAGLLRAGASVPQASAEHPVVAVMALSRGGGDPQEDALGAGIADVLTSSLSKITGVTVIPRSAGGGGGDGGGPSPSPSTFARQLGASVVVTGSVQKVANRVRIVVHLTRPESEAVFWSEAFD